VLDVHQDQLLVLLLMVEAKLDQRRRLGPDDRVGDGEELRHRGVDMSAIAADLGGTGDARPDRAAAVGGARPPPRNRS